MNLVLCSGGWSLCGLDESCPPLALEPPFPTNTLRQLLVHLKDPVPQQERPGVVYHIPCTNFSWAYIGQTGRTLTQRLKEHRRAVINGDLTTSALAEHAHSTSQPINWTEARVIATCSHTFRRCLLESWMIHRETNHPNSELVHSPTSIRPLLGTHKWSIDKHPFCFNFNWYYKILDVYKE